MHTDTPSCPALPRCARWRRLLARALRSDVAWLAGCVLAIAAGLQLAGLAASRLIAPLPPAPAVQHDAASGIEQAGNELLYRACVREARVHALPVKPYPQESERVYFLHEGKRLVKQTETMEADVSDMSVENGCQVTLQRRVRTEPAPSATFSDGMQRMTLEQRSGEDALKAPLQAERAATPPCVLRRDLGLQSHYMLLNLCEVERAAGAAPALPAEPRRKAMRGPRRPST